MLESVIDIRLSEEIMAVTGPYEHKVSYIGLSTDTKPTEGVLPGTGFYESDTGMNYIYTGTAWVEGKE